MLSSACARGPGAALPDGRLRGTDGGTAVTGHRAQCAHASQVTGPRASSGQWVWCWGRSAHAGKGGHGRRCRKWGGRSVPRPHDCGLHGGFVAWTIRDA